MSDASLKLLQATQELIRRNAELAREAEASLDYRPELRRAIADAQQAQKAAHQAVFAVATAKRTEQLDASPVRIEFLARPTPFTGVQQ